MAGKNFNSNDPVANAIAVKRSGQRTAKLQQRIKVTKWILICLLLFVIILYLLFIFFWRGGLSGDGAGDNIDYGDFTVKIDDSSLGHISLSEDSGFEESTVFLQGTSHHKMWHCTRDWIPADIQDQSEGGAHSSDDPSYLAYTFHVKNTSDVDVVYEYDIDLTDEFIPGKLKALDAIRIMIIKNGEKTVWANPSLDGTPLEANTSQFKVDDELLKVTSNKIAIDAVDKYTVVMWFEGTDPECINDIQLSNIKFQMDFNVENRTKDVQ